jgi:alkylhydroperoxidase family enzyme
MTRISPLQPPYEPDAEQLLQQMMPAGVGPIALFRMFAKNLAMTQAMHPWGAYELGRHFTLSLRDREIVIDRTCARTGCEYEWGVHVSCFAARAGLDDKQVVSLTHGQPADDCWPESRDRLLIAAADALHDTGDVPDELWAELSATFDEPQLLDLLLLTGWYHAISYVARATRLPPEPNAPTFASITAGQLSISTA